MEGMGDFRCPAAHLRCFGRHKKKDVWQRLLTAFGPRRVPRLRLRYAAAYGRCQIFFICSREKKRTSGNDLLSPEHPVLHSGETRKGVGPDRELGVPSAQEGLTAVFGMGTGGTPPLWSPDVRKYACRGRTV